MRLRLVAFCCVAVAFLVAGGTASADSGTFSGSITPTTCGPMHPITVVVGETTIDAVAAAQVSANDITLDLYDPAGALKAHGDSATSPEEVVYQSDNLATGVWHVQVCPFAGGVIAAPYSYNGTFSTSNAPVVNVTAPGSDPGAPGGTPTPKYVAGKLVFSPATVVDPQRTEGEPLNFLDPKSNTYWESGPYGTTTQNSFIHRSTDNGLEFHIDSPDGLRPDAPPGGGDTDIAVDDQGNHYFVDLEGLVNLGTSVSNDDGNNWRKNPVAVQNAAVDRQWYTVDNGTTASAADNTVFLAFHESAVGTYIYSSPGSTGATDPVGGLVWQNASAQAPRPLAADATCGQIRFDKVTRNLYYACNEGNHVRVTVGHVAPGQRTGIQFHNVNVPDSPGGGGPGHLFPAVATDPAGTVYTAWIDTNDNNVYYSYSTDQGASWTTPVKVSTSPSNTAEFLWAQAGTPGTLALAWYATDTPGQPDVFPNWATDPQGATTVKWWGYAGVVTNAASLAPTIAQQRFTEKPMHYGQICNQGIGCTVSSGDRTMADYFAVNFDRNGALRLIYNDTTSQHHGAHLYEVRQLQGKTVNGKSVKEAVPKSPMKDVSGDAQWPHYSPTGAGSEPAAARLHEPGAQPAEPEHAAREDDGRQPGRAAASARQDERGLADAVPGALDRRLRRGGLPHLLRGCGIHRRAAAAVLRRHDHMHRHHPAELQGRAVPEADGGTGPALREHDLGRRAGQRRLRNRAAGRQDALQRHRLQLRAEQRQHRHLRGRRRNALVRLRSGRSHGGKSLLER